MMKQSIVIGAILAGTFALPVMAQTQSRNENAASTETAVVAGETIIVTGHADPRFARDCAGEGYCTFEFTQHAYDRVDGKWMDVDHLTHPDFAFAKLTAADMELQYPGA